MIRSTAGSSLEEVDFYDFPRGKDLFSLGKFLKVGQARKVFLVTRALPAGSLEQSAPTQDHFSPQSWRNCYRLNFGFLDYSSSCESSSHQFSPPDVDSGNGKHGDQQSKDTHEYPVG